MSPAGPGALLRASTARTAFRAAAAARDAGDVADLSLAPAEGEHHFTGHALRIRVHELEPVSRDQVILPDLYVRNLTLPNDLMSDLARRTDGASPAFIKEFLRRIAQHHLDAEAEGDVTRATAEAALHEMLFSGGVLNTRLLGGEAVSNEEAAA